MYARHGDPESKSIRRKGCSCDICVREDTGCKLAGHPPTLHYWESIYQQISEGYLDPRDYDVRYLQVAQIGDEVMARIKDDHMPDQD